MSNDRTSSQQLPVAFFQFTPEQLVGENLDATVEAVMTALAKVSTLRSRRDPSAPDAAPSVPS